MHDLFFGYGIAHTILLLAFVIGIGIYLSRFKVKGVSIGLQVGPGFFHSFKQGGVKMNLLAVMNILLAVAVTYAISLVSGEDLKTLVGVMSGAVTNTPGLGAAQQTFIDVSVAGGSSTLAAGEASEQLASAYAVAYPIGVVGVIAVILLFKAIFRIDHKKELELLESQADTTEKARRMHVEVDNPAIFGKKLTEVLHSFGGEFVVSRVMKKDQILFPSADVVLEEGDKLLIVTSQGEVDRIRILFGKEVPMHVQDWQVKDHNMVTRRIVVTQPKLTGKTLKELMFRSAYGVSVTRVIRAGVELVASKDLYLQMGDALVCVGTEQNIDHVAQIVGNSAEALNKPNLVPIFLGIVVGVIFGSIPLKFPGIPQAIKLGLAGGPLIIAILLGHWGPKFKITTYTTASANLMIREIGISLFLAAVGIGAGGEFWSSIVGGGYWWILYGACITLVPLCITFVVARVVCKLNFYQICGLISGSCTNPPVLAFSQGMYGSDYTSVNYATVYPLSMFMRVLVAQLLILIAMA